MREPRKVLIGVLEYGELPEMLRVADLVRDWLGHRPIIAFVKPIYRRLAQDSASVVARGHVWTDGSGVIRDVPARGEPASELAEDLQGGSRPEEPKPGAVRRWPKGLAIAAGAAAFAGLALAEIVRGAAKAVRAVVVDLVVLAKDIAYLRSRDRTIGQLLEKVRPSLVIAGQAPVGTELAFLLRCARGMGIPTLIVPFAQVNLRVFGEYAHGRPELAVTARPLNRVLALLYPHWQASFRGRHVLRLQGTRGLALEWCGLIDSHPWRPWTVPVDAIACESHKSREEMDRIGTADNAVHVVGSPVHDRFFAILKRDDGPDADILSGFDLDPDRRLLVCGWPVNMFSWLGDRKIAFSSYREVADVWARALSTVRDTYGWNVVISAHPKTLAGELAAARELNLPIVHGQTETLIATCDLFTTLNGSSITSWALACGKPVVLFDCFETGYTEFQDVPGCRLVSRQDEFDKMFALLCGNEAELAQLRQQSEVGAPQCGLIDGKASERLAGLVTSLMQDR